MPQTLIYFSSDNGQTATDSIVLEFNMSALSALLKKQSEQNPSASYFNVDILKYQVSLTHFLFTHCNLVNFR